MRLPNLRLLLTFVRPHRNAMALGLGLGLVTSAAGLATPLVTKWVIDTLGAGTSLFWPVAGLLGLVLIGGAIGLFQWVLMGTLAERVVLGARVGVIHRYFGARIGALTGRSTGELVTRATSDTALLHDASASLVSIVNSALAFVATLVLMGVLDLVLLATTLASVVLVGALMSWLLPSIGRATEQAQAAVGTLGGDLEGTLRAIRTVKASRAEERQAARIVAAAEESAKYGIVAARRAAVVLTISWTGVQIALIIVLGLGAWRAGRGLLEVSSLIAFLLYAFQLMGPISQLTQNVTSLQSGIAAAARIRQVDALPAEPTALPAETTGVSAGTDGPVLTFRGVTARYAPGAPAAVDGIDLEIPRRGHTAIVGPTGAGKTTLFSLMLRFLEPADGELLLDGRPYREFAPATIRARLAYVEQETPVVPGTIRDNVLFTHPDASDDEVRRVLDAVRLTDKVDSLPDGLDTPLASTQVSGGERQRIALARAILRTPDVLLLDEATAQVDGLTEAALHACVAERAAAGAVVTIAHRLSTVLDADRIVVLDGGRVRAQGTHTELLAGDDLYRRLVEALRIATPQPAVA